MDLTRRGFVKGAAAAGLAGSSTIALSAGARADHVDQKPEHVTLDFDESWLSTYQPRLVLEGESREKLNGMYSWRASSPEESTDVGVYWAEYTHQEGVTSFDSHYGDHEPVYVFVEDGDVVEIVYSGYHWLKASSRAPPTVDETRPTLQVIAPWHHYATTVEHGVDTDLLDLDDVFSSWLSNGLEDDLAEGVVVNPWRMRTRSYWWQENRFGFSGTALVVGAFHKIGLFGAEETDL